LPLNLDETVDGDITNENFTRYHRFEASANDLINIRMERLTGGLDAFVRLLDNNGAELASNDDIEGSQNSAINQFLVPADGFYVIAATRFEGREGQTTGQYRLTLELQENLQSDIPEDVTFIPYGSTLTGRIDDETPSMAYAFFGREDEIVTASLNRGDGDLDPVIEILNESGTVLVSNDDAGEQTRNARIERFRIPQTGVYYLRARRFEGERGNLNTRGSFIMTLAQRFDAD
jgi:hypothetical protein